MEVCPTWFEDSQLDGYGFEPKKLDFLGVMDNTWSTTGSHSMFNRIYHIFFIDFSLCAQF